MQQKHLTSRPRLRGASQPEDGASGAAAQHVPNTSDDDGENRNFDGAPTDGSGSERRGRRREESEEQSRFYL